MKQVIQDFKTGEIKVLDVPEPVLEKGFVLVKNLYSVVSAGTERGTVATAQKNLLGKAYSRPDLVRQVITQVQKKGLSSTISKVKSKLDSFKALGYSSAGRVIKIGDGVTEVQKGDFVACAGSGYASHADIVCVPKNLVAKIPENVRIEHAAFTTIGSIALQGVRQTPLNIGDNVAVIGLGLIGLITVQILKAGGARVFGIDINDSVVEKSLELGCDAAVNGNLPNLAEICRSFTNECGFDSVIITASSKSSQPVEIAGEIVREQGTVVIVGAVNMNFPRQRYYEKELRIKLSRSYGPGRYDPDYEEKGIDYPFGYVRWTENRNMQAFLQLLSQKRIDVEPLISHIFDVEEAVKAYELLTNNSDATPLGIVIKYSETVTDTKEKYALPIASKNGHLEKKLKVGFIGAGNFAQTYLLPEIVHNEEKMALVGIATKHGYTGQKVAAKYKVNFYTTRAEEIYSSDEINTVFIATRHDTHSEYLLASLNANKYVFLEKPLAINLALLKSVFQYVNGKQTIPIFMVGYNRRFAEPVQQLKKVLQNRQAPLCVNYRINAGYITKSHWSQDKDIGGGRIVGEVCHFIDLINFLTDAHPARVFAHAIAEDTLNIALTYSDHSIANISYWANGNDRLAKEYLEVFCESQSMILNDFREVLIYSGKKKKKITAKGGRDIGRKQVIEAFIKGCETGSFPIPLESLFYTSLTTFKIEESLRTNSQLPVDINELI